MFIWHYTCLSSAWKIFIWWYSYLSFRIQVKFYLLCEDFLDFWAVCPLCSHWCFNDSSNQFILLVHSLSCVRSLQLQALQHTRHPCPSLSPRVCSKSCPCVSDTLLDPYCWFIHIELTANSNRTHAWRKCVWHTYFLCKAHDSLLALRNTRPQFNTWGSL